MFVKGKKKVSLLIKPVDSATDLTAPNQENKDDTVTNTNSLQQQTTSVESIPINSASVIPFKRAQKNCKYLICTAF